MLNPYSSAHHAAIRLRSTIDFKRKFDSYELITAYVAAFARDNNFWTRQRGSGKPRVANHHGAFECWCRTDPTDLDEVGVEIINRGDARTPRALKKSNKGQQMTGCKWYLAFAINNKTLTYHFTGNFQHTGHDPLLEQVNIDSVHSERNIPDEVYSKCQLCLSTGLLRKANQVVRRRRIYNAN